ncbi:MAG: cellulose biosynthesis protein BcsQ [Stellaceae bacterium]
MPLITITSFKGGAGKTMLAANLAVGLHSVGWDVFAIDFNPQDALKLHFGLDPLDQRGFAARMLAGENWEDSIFGAEGGIDVMPFGRVQAALAGSVSGLLDNDTERVIAGLKKLAESRMVVVDAPSLPSVTARRLAAAADIVVVATPTDAGSYAALSLADAETFFAADGILSRTLVVANQFDDTARLQRDIHALLSRTFGSRLAATICRDQVVDEALASRRTVLMHDHGSKAARSLVALAVEVDRRCAPRGEIH